MTFRQMAAFLAFAAMTATAAAFGAQFMPGEWYAALAKPDWSPPNWIFGPVWSVLYVLIAVSGWLAWRAEGLGVASLLWAAQMTLNGLWSLLFFGLQRIDWALADIVLLLVLIVAYILVTWRSSPTAALLLVPYGLWVAFATALNAALWSLNP